MNKFLINKMYYLNNKTIFFFLSICEIVFNRKKNLNLLDFFRNMNIFLYFLFGKKLSKEIKNQYVLEIWLDLTPKYLSKKKLSLKSLFSQ